MTIAFMIEGRTEAIFLPFLRAFLETRLAGRMPRIRASRYDGRIPIDHKLRREVRLLLQENDAVVALTDVYTGTKEFIDAADAKMKMRQWAGEYTHRFYAHAAQYDFEAWLLPYWDRIVKLSGHQGAPPTGPPEKVNHDRPPSWYIKEAYRRGGKRTYVKPRDAAKILEGCDLSTAADRCSELKQLINTFLRLGGVEVLP
jgi:hypothetical protein